jgi:hypothetical protein
MNREFGSIGALGDAIVLVAPCLYFIRFNEVGDLFGTDVVFLSIAPVVLLSMGGLLASPRPRRFLLLGVVWLGGQVLTDIIRGTPSDDCARGWAMIAAFLIEFATIYSLLWRNRRRMVLFLLGWLVGAVLVAKLNPFFAVQGNPWKFVLGMPAIAMTAVLLGYTVFRHSRLLVAMVLVLLAGFSIYRGARGLGGYCLIAAVASACGGRGSTVRSYSSVVVGTIILLTISSYATVRLYGYAAKQGLLGEAAQSKYAIQSSSELGIFGGGRPEVLYAIEAIADSPIIGHGSWAKDPSYVLEMNAEGAAQGFMARPRPLTSENDTIIPAHSHLFGGWMNAGILAVPFWLYVVALTVRSLLVAFQLDDSFVPLVAFTSTMLLWDIFLSPFGAERRFLEPFLIILAMSFADTEPAARLNSLWVASAVDKGISLADAEVTSALRRS